ncbi:universal stress protein [Saccharopolyspora subtropica]|uniref:Universal stress protein n=1 Tax=Saccharopolyspora thermophila TaxID=89367 RepID=A0A917JZQ8_9PSEU|nr:universal stress protein [Saccharopolyspora subtropica]GGI92215.1 universal stress protein [Saccharopolyspora subtropica]
MSGTDRPVVVGVDGSDSSLHAAEWAAAEANRRHAPLHVLIVNDDPARSDYAENTARRTAAKCHASLPQLPVTTEVAEGHPVEVLVRRSGQAQLVVLGARGHGGFANALLGGVSTAVATHADCPVVVIRRGVPTTVGPVVAGVDGSPCSQEALHFAYASADRLGADLVVMQVWHEEGLLTVPLTPYDRERVEQKISNSLAQQAAALRDQYPRVRTREVVQRGHPVAALTDAARDARLLVVGHRGRGDFGGLFLGSVAAGVLHHAQCPVAVVRSPAGSDRSTGA